jgi:hypothetical protein
MDQNTIWDMGCCYKRVPKTSASSPSVCSRQQGHGSEHDMGIWAAVIKEYQGPQLRALQYAARRAVMGFYHVT